MRRIVKFPARHRIQGSGLPLAGRVRKGDPIRQSKNGKPMPGLERPFFRIEWNAENPLIDPVRAQAVFDEIYGNEPVKLSPIAFIRDNTETIWGTANELYGRAESGKAIQKIACDGESIYRWRTPENTFSTQAKPCESDNQRACGCQAVGRLFFVLPEFSQAYGVVSEFMLITQGTVDIDQITNTVDLYKNLGMSRLAFALYRTPEDIPAPNGVISTKHNVKLVLESASVQRATAAITSGSSAGGLLPSGMIRLDPVVCKWDVDGGAEYRFKGKSGVFHTHDAALVEAVCKFVPVLPHGKPVRLDFEAVEAAVNGNVITYLRGIE